MQITSLVFTTLLLFVVSCTMVQAVLNGERAYGYRYNGPAHKYLPPTPPKETVTSGYKYQVPVTTTLTASTGYDYKAPQRTEYNSMPSYYQEPQLLTPLAAGATYEQQQQQKQQQQQQSGVNYFVPKAPMSLHESKQESYYVPHGYNSNNNKQTGYNYATMTAATATAAAAPSHTSSGYHYEAPIASHNLNFHYDAGKEQQGYGFLANQKHTNQQQEQQYKGFPIEQSTATYTTPSTTSNGIYATSAFGLSAAAHNGANYEMNYVQQQQQQQQHGHNLLSNNNKLAITTAASNDKSNIADYMQMQSHSYELPSYYTMQREYPQQQQKHDYHQQQQQQQFYHNTVSSNALYAAPTQQREQHSKQPLTTSYGTPLDSAQVQSSGVASAGAGYTYTTPSLQFQPPYY